MSAATSIAHARERVSLFWLARTEQERRTLGIGGAVALVALVYALFIGPALDGRAQLQKSLPLLRQQAAEMQAMALEAGELARQPAPQVAPMTRASLSASLSARSIKPESVTLTAEYAKLQLTGVSFANLVSWLDAARREQRITVQDATINGLDGLGQVDAVLTLRQDNTAAQAAAR
jgi:general secretion pathway protein M